MKTIKYWWYAGLGRLLLGVGRRAHGFALWLIDWSAYFGMTANVVREPSEPSGSAHLYPDDGLPPYCPTDDLPEIAPARPFPVHSYTKKKKRKKPARRRARKHVPFYPPEELRDE